MALTIEAVFPVFLRFFSWLLNRRPIALLVVDDNPADREIAREVIGECGYRCDVAESATEALGLLRGRRYAVLVSDWNLVGMDGWELSCRAREMSPRMKVVLMVGSTLSLAGMDPGSFVDGLAIKPVTHGSIRRMMKGV